MKQNFYQLFTYVGDFCRRIKLKIVCSFLVSYITFNRCHKYFSFLPSIPGCTILKVYVKTSRITDKNIKLHKCINRYLKLFKKMNFILFLLQNFSHTFSIIQDLF